MKQTYAMRSWMVAIAATAFGLGAYYYDNQVKDAQAEGSTIKRVLNDFELMVMGPAMGILGFVTMENLRLKDEAHVRNLEHERRQRFLQLGQIAASMAHEIRNPLQNLHLIKEELRVARPEETARWLQRLEVNLTRLDFAVKLAYELSRPNFAVDDVDSIELVPFVETCLLEVGAHLGRALPVVHAKPVDLVLVGARAQGLRIVIENLLRNAFEACPGERVQVNYLPSAQQWVLEIINQGTMPQAVLSGNEAFQSEKPAGIGVGVSISRHLASNFGAELTYTNRAGTVVTHLRLSRVASVGGEVTAETDV
jgi:signal transduction histidine kinase